MSTRPFVATIRPAVNANITEINTRGGPGTNYGIPFRAATGLNNLTILDVQPDEEQIEHNGKVYQWFLLEFPDNQQSWIRDDLINIKGDGTGFGYGFLSTDMYALELSRAVSNPRRNQQSVWSQAKDIMRTGTVDDADEPVVTDEPAPIEEDTPVTEAPTTITEDERIVKAAFNITGAFEGTGYASYQNIDKGIISYGRFQFTLQSGSLATVVNRYIETADDRMTQTLRWDYQIRLTQRDETLRDDERLKAVLIRAAEEKAMQAAQDAIAYELYWRRMYDLSVIPRNIQLPLSQAMFFDISIQHGTHHDIFASAERELGVPIRSRVGENGTDERTFVKTAANIRRDILYRIATAQGLPGVRKRADFWIQIIQKGDWHLQGNTSGNLNVLGRTAQVRNP